MSLYGNLSLDILYFDWDLSPLFKIIGQSHEWLTTTAFENLKNVAVERAYWKRHTHLGGKTRRRCKRALRCHLGQFEKLEKFIFVRKRVLHIEEMEFDTVYVEHTKVRNLDERELMETHEQDEDWDQHQKWLETYYSGYDLWGEEKPKFLSAQIVSTDENAIR
jgi:hypothetical protein